MPNPASSPEPSAARPRRRRWLTPRALRGALVLLALALFARTLLRADLHGVLACLCALGPSVLVVMLPYAALLLCETTGWQQLFRLVGARVRLLPLLSVRATSTGVSAMLPAGAIAAEGLKPLLVTRATGLPPAPTTATLAGCKAMLMSTQSLYLGAVTLAAWPTIAAASAQLGFGRTLPYVFVGASVLLMIVAVSFVLLVSRAEVAHRFFHALSALPIRPLRAYLEARRTAFLATDAHLVRLFSARPIELARAAAPYLASWFCEALESYVILRLLGVRLGFFEVAALDASVSLLRSLAFALPSGLGVTDAAYVAMLGAFGVPDPAVHGAAFVLLKRGKELLWVGGGLSLLLFARKRTAPRPARIKVALPARIEVARPARIEVARMELEAREAVPDA